MSNSLAVSREQIINKITDQQIWFSCASVYYATSQNRSARIPLDIDRAATFF
jgi:hypothetical protein